jgi:hypothetical protein
VADLSQLSDEELARIAGQAPQVTPERLASAKKLFGNKAGDTLAQIDKYPAIPQGKDLSQYSDEELKAMAGSKSAPKSILQDLLGMAKAAGGAAVNEQSFGLLNPAEQEQKESPLAATTGRVLSYGPGLFLGTGEESLAKRLLAGPASALMHGTEKAVEKAVPTAIGKVAAKVPAVLGASAAAQTAGKNIRELGGIDSSQIAAEASKAATDPSMLGLGYLGQLVGAAGRAASVPERTYGLSGAVEGKLPSEAIPDARRLMDKGITSFTTEGLMNKAKAALTPVAKERSAIIDKANKVAPNYAFSAKDLTEPLKKSAIEASQSVSYPERSQAPFELMSRIYSKYGGEPLDLNKIEAIKQIEQRALRNATSGGKIAELFNGAIDSNASAKLDASRDLISRATELEKKAIKDILPKELGMTDERGNPQNIERFNEVNDQYGALKEAKQNFAERAGKEMTPYMKAASIKYPIRSAINRSIFPPLATNTASILDKILNKEKGVSAPAATAIIQRLLSQGQ